MVGLRKCGGATLPAIVPDRHQATLPCVGIAVVKIDPPARYIEPPPPQSRHADNAAKRLLQSLLADPRLFESSESVGLALLKVTEASGDPKLESTRWRRKGWIFGAWDGRHFRYPRFQFGTEGRPLSSIAVLVDVLPRDSDGSNNDAVLWLFAPDAALDGRTPAEVFPEDADRVINLARQRAHGN